MEEGLLSLKWNNHKTTFFDILKALRDKAHYSDATLAVEGRFYQVHKLVLSTCSEYFTDIFENTACKSPVIVLKDVRSQDLEALLDYMYLGEVNVKQNDLGLLIKTAESLKIKGLAVPDEHITNIKSTSVPSNIKNHTLDENENPPAKRRKDDNTKHMNNSLSKSNTNAPHSNKVPVFNVNKVSSKSVDNTKSRTETLSPTNEARDNLASVVKVEEEMVPEIDDSVAQENSEVINDDHDIDNQSTAASQDQDDPESWWDEGDQQDSTGDDANIQNAGIINSNLEKSATDVNFVHSKTISEKEWRTLVEKDKMLAPNTKLVEASKVVLNLIGQNGDHSEYSAVKENNQNRSIRSMGKIVPIKVRRIPKNISVKNFSNINAEKSVAQNILKARTLHDKTAILNKGYSFYQNTNKVNLNDKDEIFENNLKIDKEVRQINNTDTDNSGRILNMNWSMPSTSFQVNDVTYNEAESLFNKTKPSSIESTNMNECDRIFAENDLMYQVDQFGLEEYANKMQNKKLKHEFDSKMSTVTLVENSSFVSNSTVPVSPKTIKSTFTCALCNKVLKSRMSLTVHMRSHTGERPFQCHICLHSSSQISNLNKHLKSKHCIRFPKHKRRKHTVLNRESVTSPNLRKGKLESKNEVGLELVDENKKCEELGSVFTCGICSKVLKYRQTLVGHMRLHTGEKPFKCHICSFSASHYQALNRHLKSKHGQRQTYSKSYNSTTTSPLSSKQEFESGNDLISEKDGIKNKKIEEEFESKKFILAPAKISSNIFESSVTTIPKRMKSAFTCAVCDKVLKYRNSLIVHMRLHTGEKPYHCHICSFSAPHCSGLKHHVLKEHRPRGNKSRKGNRKRKVKTASELGSVGVEVDENKEFADTSASKESMLTAVKNSPITVKASLPTVPKTINTVFKCKVCGKVFKHRQTLLLHTRLHTRKKAFHCHICSYRLPPHHYGMKNHLWSKHRIRSQKSSGSKKLKKTCTEKETEKSEIKWEKELTFQKVQDSYKSELVSNRRTEDYLPLSMKCKVKLTKLSYHELERCLEVAESTSKPRVSNLFENQSQSHRSISEYKVTAESSQEGIDVDKVNKSNLCKDFIGFSNLDNQQTSKFPLEDSEFDFLQKNMFKKCDETATVDSIAADYNFNVEQ